MDIVSKSLYILSKIFLYNFFFFLKAVVHFLNALATGDMNRVGKCGQNHRLDAFLSLAILVYFVRMNNERLYVMGHCYGGGLPYQETHNEA